MRLNAPAQAKLSSGTYDVHDWSVGGFSIVTKLGPRAIGERVKVQFRLDLQQTAVLISAHAIIRHVTATSGHTMRIGYAFAELAAEQTALLRHVSKMAMTGKEESSLTAAPIPFPTDRSRHKAASLRSSWATYAGQLRQRIIGASVLLVCLVLLGLFVRYFWDSAFTVEAVSATIVSDNITVASPASGQIDFLFADASGEIDQGTPLVVIGRPTGTPLSSDSPCDCVILDTFVDLRWYVEKGDPLFELASRNAPVRVMARVPLEEARSLRKSDRAHVRILGEDAVAVGSIVDLQVDELLATAEVEIDVGDSYPRDQIGRPVVVTFNRSPLSFGS